VSCCFLSWYCKVKGAVVIAIASLSNVHVGNVRDGVVWLAGGGEDNQTHEVVVVS